MDVLQGESGLPGNPGLDGLDGDTGPSGPPVIPLWSKHAIFQYDLPPPVNWVMPMTNTKYWHNACNERCLIQDLKTMVEIEILK